MHFGFGFWFRAQNLSPSNDLYSGPDFGWPKNIPGQKYLFHTTLAQGPGWVIPKSNTQRGHNHHTPPQPASPSALCQTRSSAEGLKPRAPGDHMMPHVRRRRHTSRRRTSAGPGWRWCGPAAWSSSRSPRTSATGLGEGSGKGDGPANVGPNTTSDRIHTHTVHTNSYSYSQTILIQYSYNYSSTQAL